jgi:uncharacterized OB-fold protein
MFDTPVNGRSTHAGDRSKICAFAQAFICRVPLRRQCPAIGQIVRIRGGPLNSGQNRMREAETMSDWTKVTRPIPVPNEWTKPFWDAARRNVLELQRCQSCGHFQHPPYATCVQCMGIDLKFEPVRGEGAIYAYTIMYHTGDKRFASAVPYASIVVELDDAPGALMAGNLLEAEYTDAKVGRRVEVIFEPLNDSITLPQFRLARV